jgi:hypothetical protein
MKKKLDSIPRYAKIDLSTTTQRENKMGRLKKNQETGNGRVLSTDYFDKRRKVMSIIYAAKKIYPNAPRVEVKIMTGTGGIAWLGKNCIAIGADIQKEDLVTVVLHELVHTWFKQGHDERCPLMKSRYSVGEESDMVAWKTFQKYVEKYR